MNQCIPLTLVALLLAGCSSLSGRNEAPGPDSRATGLNVQQARITDKRIAADKDTLAAVQDRLRKLNEAGVPQRNYGLAKAQCWLDTAYTQYSENDRTGYIEESLTESMRIIQALEADPSAKAGRETPLVARSTRLREDLWARLEKMKATEAALACNGQTVACAEVRLVRAGHAEEQTGWRQAVPHVRMVEDAVQRAEAEGAQCGAPVRAVAVAPVVPAPVAPAPAAATSSKESIVILSDALFRFARSSLGDLQPGGKARLDEVVARVKGYRVIDKITIVGHTDRIGQAAANDRLSLARAEAVKAYFASAGLPGAKIEARGAGESDPATGDQCKDDLERPALISCLQPDRRVTVEVTGTR